MTRKLLIIFVLLLTAPMLFARAEAQDSNNSDKSALTRFVESKLSSENRQISLNGIQGALSSDAAIDEITVADRDGVWLRIVKAHLIWTRSALLFGRLEIDQLTADKIEVLRKPLPAKGAPAPSSSGFSLPKLPVSVTLKKLSVPEVDFGDGVFGLKSRISVDGGLKLADGVLDSKLAIKRLDGPGGTLKLAASYADDTRMLDLDLKLNEPKNGILANLLNIEGRPAVAFSLTGKGPIGKLELDTTLDAAGKRALTGKVKLDQKGDGLAVDADVHGPIANLVAPAFRGFFGGKTALKANALVKAGGGLKISTLTLTSGALNVDAKAETTADNFLKLLDVKARIANADGSGVLLPVSGQKDMVKSVDVTVDYGNTGSDKWSGKLAVNRLGTKTLGADSVTLDFGGTVNGIDTPKNRSISYTATGRISGISTKNPNVKTALGDRIELSANGDWSSGQPVTIASAAIKANQLALTVAGAIRDLVFDGTIGVKAASLAPFSDFANRPLAGAVDLSAKGTIKPVSGAFDLTLDGSGQNIKTGSDKLDALLASDVKVSGGFARTKSGFIARHFAIADQQMSVKADGGYAPEKADLKLDVMLADLGLVTERATGKLTLSAAVRGNKESMGLMFDGAIPDGTLSGRKLTGAKIAFDGNLLGIDPQKGRPYGNGVSGQITGNGALDGEAASLRSGVLATPDESKLTGLEFRAGGTKLAGSLDRDGAGLIDGQIKLDAPDISLAAALATIKAGGSANATIGLSHDDGRQHADIAAQLSGVSVPSAQIGSADIKATIDDLFGVPMVDGHATAMGVKAGGVAVKSATVDAGRNGNATAFKAAAVLENGTRIATAGNLAQVESGFRLGLNQLDLTQGQMAAHLKQPAEVEVKGSAVDITRALQLDVAGGSVKASGSAGDTFDLAIAIDKLPLSIANAVKPDLAAGGTLSGTAKVRGPRSKPNVSFNVRAKGITARPIADAGLPAFDLDASGKTAGERVDLDAKLSSGSGISVTAKGSVPTGNGDIDLAIDIVRFPIATLDGLSRGQNPDGTLTGTAKVTGTLKNPAATFKAKGSGISAAPLKKFGVAPLSIDASGSFRDKSVSLQTVAVSNGQGLSLSASGRVPLAGSGLGIHVKGNAPLTLANRALADRGTRVDGNLTFSLNLSGALAKPVIGGMVSAGNVNVVDPGSGVRFRGISVMLGISDNRVTINRFNAPLATGGTITASGGFSIDAGANYPADITINLNKARYVKGDLITAKASGKLTVSGRLTRDPTISGRIAVERADIGIPGSLGGSASLTDVRHLHAPAPVKATLDRAKIHHGGVPVPKARPSIVHLNLFIDAPRRVFIRGRGIDAEMGGRIHLRGPVTDVSAIGGFDLIRGRLSILGKRIDFNSGTVTLTGTLDPLINFVAQSNAGDSTTVTITVSGRASDPKIDFSSQPALPQDEVLSQLIFGRSISDLSGFQIAQLAAAVAELAGGQNNSLLGSLRKATGLDDLDVSTDANGNATVKAGRYIRDNVYLGVEAGAKGDTKVDINLDITRNLKAKASAGAKGDSGIGLFYEKDY